MTPDKCPRCGAGSVNYDGVFWCGSHFGVETEKCLTRQRDALAARVKELEEELEGHAWEINPAMAQAAIDGHVAKIAKLEARVKELEAYAAALETQGDAVIKLFPRSSASFDGAAAIWGNVIKAKLGVNHWRKGA